MARRKTSLFNLSFLDLLSGALGAVIFLFVITPKGGSPAAKVSQVALYVDTLSGQFYGDLPDSLRYKGIGDTLFTILVDYRKMPGTEQRAKIPAPVALREPKVTAPKPKTRTPEKPKTEASPAPAEKPAKETSKPAPPKPTPAPSEPAYRGDAPSVPCLLSFELSWPSRQTNVDLYVCKGDECVYGGRKRDRNIGEWDSGKSRNRLFGNDLRTNQEAVRQFDRILPGEYKLYALFKEGRKDEQSVLVDGLIYTQGPDGQERGTNFSRTLTLSDERVLLGTVLVYENGQFSFLKP